MTTKCRAERADQVLEALIAIIANAKERYGTAYVPTILFNQAEAAIAEATQPANGVAYCAGCDNTFPLEELRKHTDGVFCANCRPFGEHGRYIPTEVQHVAVESVTITPSHILISSRNSLDVTRGMLLQAREHTQAAEKRCVDAEGKLSRIADAVNTYHDMMNKRPGLYAESQLELCLSVERIMEMKFERTEAKE